jgi:serine/threonine-protein kinase
MAQNQKYKLIERVDAGGMAEVYRGVAESLEGFKKNVAIKRILPNLTKNKKFVSMFLDEARLSLHLQHANVVQVFDIGMADGSYFIVMEFVDGANLKNITESLKRQGKRMRVSHALYLVMEVSKGLAYAHDLADPENSRPLGIVHRDVSPPNILVSKTGEVKLVDFGLAKAASQIEDTEPGVVKGKFSYLSPEAAHGREVDHRADIFAVGILLYELLTGKRLFVGENDYQTVELVRAARVPALSAQNPEVEPELEGIVRKALAKDPEDRFQHSADMLDALAQYLFSRGMKVTSRDIKALLGDVQRERERSAPPRTQVTTSLLDSLIKDEILHFTSLEQLENGAVIGATPLDSGEIPAELSTDLIDPRAWALDADDGENNVGPRHHEADSEYDEPTPTERHVETVTLLPRKVRSGAAAGLEAATDEHAAMPPPPVSFANGHGLDALPSGEDSQTPRLEPLAAHEEQRPFPALFVIGIVMLFALAALAAFVLRSR